MPLTFAANLTSTSKATATLNRSCQFVASDVAFGNYDPNATVHTQTTQSVNVTCSKGTAYRV